MGDQILPEIFIDLNAAMPKGYLLTNGSFSDLASLGLDPLQCLGKRLRFVAADEPDEYDRPGDLYFEGTIMKDDAFGLLAVPDEAGVRWRAKG